MENFRNDITKLINAEHEYTKEGFNGFVGSIKSLAEDNFVVEASQSNSKSRRTKFVNPWITQGIINSVNRKHLYYKQWCRSKRKHNKDGNHELYMRYKNLRKRLKHTINYAKKRYYCKKFNKVKGNMKKTWALINELRGKAKSNIKTSCRIDGNLVTDKRTIANGFNQFYSSVARKMNV